MERFLFFVSYQEAWMHFQRNLLAVLIRGLHEHWSRSQRGSDVAKLIEAFILVQVVHSSWIEWRYRVSDNRPSSSILFSTSPSRLMNLGITPPGLVPRLLLQFHGHSKVQLTFLTRLLTWMLCHRRKSSFCSYTNTQRTPSIGRTNHDLP